MILIPLGLILHFLGGLIGILGDLMFVFGIIDFIRVMIKKNKEKKDSSSFLSQKDN